MATPRIEVSIRFKPLLLTITQCLELPEPKYGIVGTEGNKVSVTLRSIDNSIEGVYFGGNSTTLEESMEKAAQYAIHDLIKKYGIYVKDVTAARKEGCERLTNLWQLKRQELQRVQKGLPKLHQVQEFEFHEMSQLNFVTLDFMQTLEEVTNKIQVKCSAPEVVEHTPTNFTAWLTINHHNTQKGTEATFTSTAANSARALQELAEQVINYLVPIYNIEVIDANYVANNNDITDLVCENIKNRCLKLKETPRNGV